MPERANALERVRLGDAGIRIISPEQLRSVSLRRVLDQREIGSWVLDEAHCLSRWGHDFRPDYRYMGRFIREKAGQDPIPPVLCLTATAKPDVKEEIAGYFHQELGIELRVFDGGAGRTNLDFVVVPTRGSAKFDDIYQLLQEDLPDHVPGGAIIYCVTRRHSEEVAQFLQEAGRAGRDQQAARCVLLYSQDDVERQFGMSARSRLTRQEIHEVLRALRNLDRKKRLNGEVVATAGEILREDDEGAFEQDSANDDMRVRTAVAWLEEAVLLTREANRVQVFPSSLRVGSIDEAEVRLARTDITNENRKQLLTICQSLFQADVDEGISTDELMAVSGLTPESVRKALYDLEAMGIASNDTALTAFVHVGVERASRNRLQEASDLEQGLIDLMRERAPDMEKRETSTLHRGRRSRRWWWRRKPGIAGTRPGDGAGDAAAGVGSFGENGRTAPHRGGPAA